MASVGRKPLATGHVNRLDGSERAKQRMTVILETLRGQMTIPVACQALGVCESRFHALRQHWLQESLELLEPRQPGRPPQPATDPQQVELAHANAELQWRLQQTEVQLDLHRGLATVTASEAPAKKKCSPRRRRRSSVVQQGAAQPR